MPHESTPNDYKNILKYFLIIAFSFFIFRTAWLGDDSYITLRTVDNWVNGYGITWNIGERVQTYTHPLWMLLISLIYFITRNGYFSLLIVCLLTSITTITLFINYFSRNEYSVLFGAALLLISKSFIDYSTSGLENPLSHLLLILFAISITSHDNSKNVNGFLKLSIIAGLATFNRMDTVLFYIPSLLYLWFTQRRYLQGIKDLIIGFSPFLAWELFSIFYYGFPFPNTAYAKLNAGVNEAELLSQGFLYFLNSLNYDPITLLTITTSLLIIVIIGNDKDKALSLGTCLYLVYVLYIGGDFMSGRFFSAPYLISSFLLVKNFFMLSDANISKLSIVIILGLLGLFSPINTIQYLKFPAEKQINEWSNIDPITMIADERPAYTPYTNPMMLSKNLETPKHPWMQEGISQKLNKNEVLIVEAAGFVGYYSGPGVHIIDVYALGDPLLARMEVVKNKPWRIGHFQRDLPSGYLDTIKIEKNRIRDANIAEYFDHLKEITSGNLFSWKRLLTIWNMNSGQYEYLIKPNT